MTLRVWVDGVPLPPGEASVSVLDRGFLFGDSVYEVLRTARGELLRPGEHLGRLEHSAATLRLPLPVPLPQLAAELEQAVAGADGGEWRVRIILTRGTGDLELVPRPGLVPRRVVLADPLPHYPERCYREGARVALVGVPRDRPEVSDPSVKSCHTTGAVLACLEAREQGADEAFLCNSLGLLAEGTTCNIFFVRDGILCTPGLGSGILSGVTRAAILTEYAPSLGLAVEEGHYAPEVLREADEVFITSTVRGIMPVGWIDGVRYAAPGTLTGQLMEAHGREVGESPPG